MRSPLAAVLEELDRTSHPAAVRFDGDAPLLGRVAVLPAAFDPPTAAHLQLLQAAAAMAGVGTVAAMLTTRNVDKGTGGAALHHRVAMLLDARAEAPALAVLGANAARIVDQAAALRATYPGARFDFIVGYDTLVRLFATRYYSDMTAELLPFFAEHRVIAANRGADDIATVRAFVAREAGPFAARVLTLELHESAAALSSTLAREAIATGAEPPGVPLDVARYIARHQLYGARA